MYKNILGECHQEGDNMEGIFKILESEGINVSDELRPKLNKKIFSEYKTIAEYSDLKKKLEEYKSKENEYSSISSELEALKKRNAELSQINTETSNRMAVINSGVDDDFVDFVTHSAMKNVNEKTDFNKSLEDFLNNNKQYLKSTPKVTLSTYAGSESKADMSSINQMMNNFIRSKGK